jgi:flagellar hook-basal body complex protein FliE
MAIYGCRGARHSKHLSPLILQNQLDDMNAARIQEEVEREWRRREKEKARLDAENQKNLRLARDKQITHKINLQALEIEREKQEFEKILKMQKEAVCREQKEREKKHKQALVHRSEILKQVLVYYYFRNLLFRYYLLTSLESRISGLSFIQRLI